MAIRKLNKVKHQRHPRALQSKSLISPRLILVKTVIYWPSKSSRTYSNNKTRSWRRSRPTRTRWSYRFPRSSASALKTKSKCMRQRIPAKSKSWLSGLPRQPMTTLRTRNSPFLMIPGALGCGSGQKCLEPSSGTSQMPWPSTCDTSKRASCHSPSASVQASRPLSTRRPAQQISWHRCTVRANWEPCLNLKSLSHSLRPRHIMVKRRWPSGPTGPSQCQ